MSLLKPALLSFAIVFSAVSANAETLICRFEHSSAGGGWVLPIVGFEFDRATSEAVAVIPSRDGGTQTLDARIATVNDRRITLVFEEEGVSSPTNQYAPRMQHRVTYQFASHRANVSVIPLAYDNRFRGRGACTLEE